MYHDKLSPGTSNEIPMGSLNSGTKYPWGRKNLQFSTNNFLYLKMVQGRRVVSM